MRPLTIILTVLVVALAGLAIYNINQVDETSAALEKMKKVSYHRLRDAEGKIAWYRQELAKTEAKLEMLKVKAAKEPKEKAAEPAPAPVVTIADAKPEPVVPGKCSDCECKDREEVLSNGMSSPDHRPFF
jgi:hypothetical protein